MERETRQRADDRREEGMEVGKESKNCTNSRRQGNGNTAKALKVRKGSSFLQEKQPQNDVLH